MDWRAHVEGASNRAGRIEVNPGDQVRVWYKIAEQDRTRVAPFEGLVIRRRGSGAGATCTIRRVTQGEGVERVFPLRAPIIDRIEVLKRGKVRRARLYYLRTAVGKTRIAEDTQQQQQQQEEPQPT